MEVSTAEMPIKSLPVFDWSGEDFRFNVPVYFGNTELTEDKLIRLLELIN